MRALQLALLAASWLASRGWLLWLLAGPQSWVAGDVAYFRLSLQALPDVGLASTLVEYPLPAVAVLAVPYAVAGWLGDGALYEGLLGGAAVLTDLAFTLVLARARRDLLPAALWVAFVPLLGATTLARFDLLPGVLCALALLTLARRPALAGLLLAAAAGVKLWPVLALPSLLASAGSRLRVLVAAAGAGLLLVAVTLVATGWGRLLSPLTYQGDRGLQVESVAATPAMVGWSLPSAGWQVGYAASRSYEVDGPGVGLLLDLTRLATLGWGVGLAAAGWALWRRSRSGARLDPGTAVWLVLAAVTGFVVTGKVLSPQYLLWLAPVAVAGTVLSRDRTLLAWTGGLLGAALLTQLVFPLSYDVVSGGATPAWPLVLPLVARNLLLVVLLAVAVRRTRAGLLAQRGSVLARQPGGTTGAAAPRRTAR